MPAEHPPTPRGEPPGFIEGVEAEPPAESSSSLAQSPREQSPREQSPRELPTDGQSEAGRSAPDSMALASPSHHGDGADTTPAALETLKEQRKPFRQRLKESLAVKMPKMPKLPRKLPTKMPKLLGKMKLPERRKLPRSPKLDIAGKIKQMPQMYCEKLGQYPWAFILAYTFLIAVTVGASWREVKVSTDLEEFRSVDGNASMRHSIYRESLRSMRAVKNNSRINDRRAFELELFYEAWNDTSVLKEAPLRDIHAFEHKLRALSGWKKLCSMSDARAQFRCDPGESLGNYVWPKRLEPFLSPQGFFRLEFDGSSRERFPIPATLTYLNEGTAEPHNPLKFLPQNFTGITGATRVMRSLFAFTEPSVDDSAFSQEYEDFVKTELYPMIVEEIERSEREPDLEKWEEPMHIRIYFRGDYIDEYEVRYALESDLKMAAGALVFAFLISWVQLRSLFLAFSGMALLTMTTLLAYVMVPVPQVGLASFLGVFLIYGLGGNALFCLQNLWTSLERMQSTGAGLTDRVKALYVRASLEFMPLFVTAICFYAFIASLLRPLREFGIFMAALMLIACLLCFTIFVPVLVMRDTMLRPCLKRHLSERGRLREKVFIVLEPEILRPPNKAIAALISQSHSYAKPVLGITVGGLIIAFAITCGVAASRDAAGLPEIFPPSHNKNAGRPLAAAFTPTAAADRPVPPSMTVCEPGRVQGVAGCGLHWCEAPLKTSAPSAAAATENASTCTCYKNRLVTSQTCAELTVTAKMSGQFAKSLSAVDQQSALETYIRAEWPSTSTVQMVASSESRQLSSLVLEHWESGRTDVEPFVEFQSALAKMSAGVVAASGCAEEVICHCGDRVCERPSGFRASINQMELLRTDRRLSQEPVGPSPSPVHGAAAALPGGRRLTTNAGQATTEVTVLFGITPPESGKFLHGEHEWTFDETFDPVSPWAQRAMYKMCANVPAELNVLEEQCWITNFRAWLISADKKFPVERFGNFHEELKRFTAESQYESAFASMWLDSNGAMRATMFKFKVLARSSAWDVLEDELRWKVYVNNSNDQAATTASQAWPTSQAWVDAEAFDEALSSAWRVVLLTLAAVFLAGLVYTLDFQIMLCIALLCLAASIALAFFMFCIFMWEFGPWELVVLASFLSFSLEPALRMGRYFVLPEELKAEAEAEAEADLPALEEQGEKAPDDLALEDGSEAAALRAEDDEEGQGGQDGQDLEAGQDGQDLEAQAQPSADVPPEQVDPPDEAQGLEGAAAAAAATGEEAAPEFTEDMEERQASAETPEGEGPTEILHRSVYYALNTMLAMSAKLFFCGILLLPCQFRLFTRLGAVAVLVSVFWMPITLVLMPMIILFSGRTSGERDLVIFGKYASEKAKWFCS